MERKHEAVLERERKMAESEPKEAELKIEPQGEQHRHSYDHAMKKEEEQLPNQQQPTPFESKKEIEMEMKQKQPVEPKLYQAVTRGDINYLKRVTKENIEAAPLKSPQENTLLHLAASFGHHEMVQIICERFPSILTNTNIKGDTALHNAARHGHLLVVNVLIDFAKTIVDLETGNMLRKKNKDGNTALLEATRKGHQTVAKRLIDEDEELPNLVNKLGESTLYLAAEGGLDEIVNQLLGLPIDDDGRILHELSQGKTPLHAAVIQNHTRTIKILLERRQDFLELRDKDGRSSLHYAAFLGRVDVVCSLLNFSNANNYYHHMDNNGVYPIHMAAMNGHIKVIQELLLRIPDSRELHDSQARNCLHVAVMNNKENVVKFILKTPELEMLINERDEEGNTPLHLATIHGYASIANVITNNKSVDIGITNEKGLTPYEAGKEGKPSIQKVLAGRALVTTNAPLCKRQLFITADTRKDRQSKIIDNGKEEKPAIEIFKDRISALLVVATLIVTITFTAGFTIPEGGGNHNSNNNNSRSNNSSINNNKGKENMLTEVARCFYVISNTLAMYSSIASAIILLWAYLGDLNILEFALRWSMRLLAIALSMVVVTFAAGVHLVVSKLSWLAILVMPMSFMFLLCILGLFIPLQAPIFPKSCWTRMISTLSLRLLLFATRN